MQGRDVTNETHARQCFACGSVRDIGSHHAAKTPAEIGYENLRKPEIAAQVGRLITERNERIRVDADFVLRRLVELVQGDIRGAFDRDGRPLSPPDLPQDVARLVASYATTATKSSVRFIDRVRVLELIGKHVSVNAFRQAHTHSHEADEELLAAIEEGRRWAIGRP